MVAPSQTSRTPVFLVAVAYDDNEKATYTVVEAGGTKLDDGSWSVRKGCMIHVLPADRVYLTRAHAEARIVELRKEETPR